MTPRISEPVRKKRVWIGFIVLFALINPWYFAADAGSTLIMGIPLWALIILAASLGLSIFITWTIQTQWRTDSDERYDSGKEGGAGKENGDEHGRGARRDGEA
ncbi:hypothetical protein GCM10010082_15720 [Kushneria pakistanensis]|uniref:DUF3311 domain-containing protein n=1 Tax=Kushneria pakistanensis TaxID=1508770 RepID=A0ABQ3FH37_9GAMM|nr:hypothetical protein [Kushneria pakistanensis]GHC24116.1 hypothetical protein GCM10010082_15720 [Kushneria pakistanensis]